jgi:Domain of unknown function (DUF3127)
MSLEVTGKVVQLLAIQSGESQRGPWKKQDMVIETNEQYPKKIAITCWGEKADEIAKLQTGTTVQVAINIESREFNDRWYTDVKAWKIDVLEQGQTSSAVTDTAFSDDAAPAIGTDETEGDLPF